MTIRRAAPVLFAAAACLAALDGAAYAAPSGPTAGSAAPAPGQVRGQPGTAAVRTAGPRRCRRGRVRVVRGRRARCVRLATVTRGLPRRTDLLVVALGQASRSLKPLQAGARSIAAQLGARAAEYGAWEDALVRAGRAAVRARGIAAAVPRSRAAQAEDLGLQLPGPIDAIVKGDVSWERIKGAFGDDTGSAKTKTKGSLTVGGDTYEFESATEPVAKVFCPTEAGIVKASGTLAGSRAATVGGKTATERFLVFFTITGRVDRAARLTSYDVEVTISGADAAGGKYSFSGKSSGIKPRSSSAEQAVVLPSQVTLNGGTRAGGDKMAAAAIAYAQREGLKFVQDAENVFNREASCLEAKPSKPNVKKGSTATVTIQVISRITGKPVDSNLTLQPSGGAEVTPQQITTTPGKPAKVQVKMPAKRRHRPGSPVASAAGEPSVGITGLSERGRARGSIGSGGLPDAFAVTVRIAGTAAFATHTATGTLAATVVARRVGEADRWRGVATAGFTGLTAASRIAGCTYGSPASLERWTVEIEAAGDERVTVTDWVPPKGFASTFTITCRFPGGGGSATVAGQPGPAIVGVAPERFTVPGEGGTRRVAGGVKQGAFGWTNTGTVRVEPR
ncbi:MAG: hypothetical protein U0R70_04440 [Solirubrobacteraceae bacterium]